MPRMSGTLSGNSHRVYRPEGAYGRCLRQYTRSASIGEKTATKIITEYHSIEEAHAHVDEVKPPRASKALKEHWDMAVMSKRLATINVDADFPYGG